MPEPTIIPAPDSAIVPETAATETGQQINALGDKMQQSIVEKFKGLAFEAEKPVAPAASTSPPAPAPTPPPAPATPDVPATDRPPEGLSKTGKEHWERFRALSDERLATERKAREALQKEFDALKAAPKPGLPPDYEQLKAEKTALEQKLEQVALAESPRFKNYYDGGIQKQLKLVRSLGPHGEEAAKLLLAPDSEARDKRLAEIQGEMGFKGQILANAAAAILQLNTEREGELANFKENFAALRAKEAAEANERTAQELTKRQNATAILLARAKALPEFTPAANDQEHATFATEALDFITKASLGQLAPEDAALLPVAAMKAQYLEELVVPRLRAEIKALEERLTGVTKAAPQPRGEQRQPVTPDNPVFSNDPMVQIREVQRRYQEVMAGSA